ncbi:uncharacterized protein BJ171DRAFT_291917 [Polychytrium aggregatum]|uniref:uncharacterized protein n=1 Tax=Polychytrium aggregatum TaxID=110093 RepID=UPI0022FE10DB|nr:uncharacterized protein BJ171DRAFT_291917 [Polychytrium aggregatum]KAI9207122.1 hypothetical protein BJ171DRAFT_291917 [Polychytrium aggregatum]
MALGAAALILIRRAVRAEACSSKESCPKARMRSSEFLMSDATMLGSGTGKDGVVERGTGSWRLGKKLGRGSLAWEGPGEGSGLFIWFLMVHDCGNNKRDWTDALVYPKRGQACWIGKRVTPGSSRGKVRFEP